jgi:hypothetical protein
MLLFRFQGYVLITYLQANDWGALSRSLFHPSFFPHEFIL